MRVLTRSCDKAGTRRRRRSAAAAVAFCTGGCLQHAKCAGQPSAHILHGGSRRGGGVGGLALLRRRRLHAAWALRSAGVAGTNGAEGERWRPRPPLCARVAAAHCDAIIHPRGRLRLFCLLQTAGPSHSSCHDPGHLPTLPPPLRCASAPAGLPHDIIPHTPLPLLRVSPAHISSVQHTGRPAPHTDAPHFAQTPCRRECRLCCFPRCALGPLVPQQPPNPGGLAPCACNCWRFQKALAQAAAALSRCCPGQRDARSHVRKAPRRSALPAAAAACRRQSLFLLAHCMPLPAADRAASPPPAPPPCAAPARRRRPRCSRPSRCRAARRWRTASCLRP